MQRFVLIFNSVSHKIPDLKLVFRGQITTCEIRNKRKGEKKKIRVRKQDIRRYGQKRIEREKNRRKVQIAILK